jgi:CBS domain-containing protein
MTTRLSEKATSYHNTRNLVDFLQKHAPFNQMELHQLSYLVEHSEIAFYHKDDIIIGPDSGCVESLYILKKGLVRGERQATAANAGNVTLTLQPGECFPMAALLGERATRTCYRAHEDCFCFIISRESFVTVFTESDVFRDFAIRGISSLLDQANKRFKSQASDHLREGYSLDTLLAEFARKNPIVCAPDTPLRKAVELMHANNIGSMVATSETRRPIGIFTLRDLRRVIADGHEDLSIALSQVMTHNPKSLPINATAFDAALLMAEHHFAHVCLVNEHGELAGVISERDIFSLQRVNLVHLARALGNAPSYDAINLIREDIPGLVNNMLAHGASVLQINRITTLLNDYTVRRVLELTSASYQGNVPDFTWLSFGSEARMEQTLVTDQDNGILFHTSGDHEKETDRQALLDYAGIVNEKLDFCGFPLCKGNIMASNPELCLTLDEWKAKFSKLVASTTPENLLNSTILFDIRAVWGDEDTVAELQEHLVKKIANNTLCQKMLATSALRNRPPLNMFGQFTTKKSKAGRVIDLKTQGLSPFIEGLRILAIANGIVIPNTMERLAALVALKNVNEQDAAAWTEAYSFIQTIRMKHHYEQSKSGVPPSNLVLPETLNPLDKRILKEAFRQAQRLQQKLEVRYQL